MKILETGRFRRSYEKLDQSIKKRAKKQFSLFISNIFHPSLNAEKLEPKHKNIWSFRINRNFRVIFTTTSKDTVVLLDIGPHNIYRL